MMSVAGGWFFLMACEMFMLGNRDLRLAGPGLLSANGRKRREYPMRSSGDMGVMIGIIVLIDQLVWRPVIAWAEKFKFEQVESSRCSAYSPVLDFLRASKILPFRRCVITLRPAREWPDSLFRKEMCRGAGGRGKVECGLEVDIPSGTRRRAGRISLRLRRNDCLLADFTGPEFCAEFFWERARHSCAWKFTLLLAGCGRFRRACCRAEAQDSRRWRSRSYRSPRPFPPRLYFLSFCCPDSCRRRLGMGSIVLLLLGTQWYMLFNVIAGATAIPRI